jgi:hypothetical protein
MKMTILPEILIPQLYLKQLGTYIKKVDLPIRITEDGNWFRNKLDRKSYEHLPTKLWTHQNYRDRKKIRCLLT